MLEVHLEYIPVARSLGYQLQENVLVGNLCNVL